MHDQSKNHQYLYVPLTKKLNSEQNYKNVKKLPDKKLSFKKNDGSMGRSDYQNYVYTHHFTSEDYGVPSETLNEVKLNSVDDNRKNINILDILPGKHIADFLEVFFSIIVFTFLLNLFFFILVAFTS